MSKKYINSGRKNQKLKTRDQILKSTQDLMDSGDDFSLEDVAKKADISRATIYRYYSNVDILAAEAILDLNTKSSEELVESVQDKDIRSAIMDIQDYYNDLTIDFEAGFRKYMSVILNGPASKSMRGARRKKTLLMIMEQKSPNLSAEEREKLANLATVLMGVEAFVVTKDVCGLDNKQSKELLNWGLNLILEKTLVK